MSSAGPVYDAIIPSGDIDVDDRIYDALLSVESGISGRGCRGSDGGLGLMTHANAATSRSLPRIEYKRME